jgi:OOP family OmpA-OmpF porin
MKARHLLFAFLLLLLPLTSYATVPGSFDDRWYITAGAGDNIQDSSRNTSDTAFGYIGVGKFINRKWSIDAQLHYQNPQFNNSPLHYSQYGVEVDARRHFREEGRRVNPYLLAGLGYGRSDEEYDAFPNPISPGHLRRNYLTAKLGVGAQADFKHFSIRGEVAARASFDRHSAVDPQSRTFIDPLVSVGIVIPLGSEPEHAVVATALPMPMPAPMSIASTCADRDADRDGVNDCDDKCPDSKAGQTVGPDGCQVALTIDLKGVHFDFDSASLRPDSKQSLDSAIEVLQHYPAMRVEVAGHTDSVGSEDYNQRLSERRAEAVYNYLVTGGISQARLEGPNGYGEERPIAPNVNPDGSDNPEGRAQNRRTELNVQN